MYAYMGGAVCIGYKIHSLSKVYHSVSARRVYTLIGITISKEGIYPHWCQHGGYIPSLVSVTDKQQISGAIQAVCNTDGL